MRPYFLAIPLLALTVGQGTAQQGSAVLPVAVALSDKYSGNCPARLEFVGHVTVTVPGTLIEYRWERSNGDSGKLLRAQIGAPAKPGDSTRATITVAIPSDVWHTGQPGRNNQFSAVLHIERPVDIRSAPARVQVECRD